MNRLKRLFLLMILSFTFVISINAIPQRKFDTDFLVHIRIYDAKDEKYSRELKQLFSEQMDKFQRKIKHYPDIHVYIRITPDDAFYNNLIKNKSKILEFSDGFTDLRTKEIFLRNPRSIRDLSRYNQLVLHEYIHLFVSYYWSDAPLWFHEGMSVYFSEGISFDRYSDFMRFYAYKPVNLIKENPKQYPQNAHFYSAYYFQSAQAIKKLYLDNPRYFDSLWDYKYFQFENAFIKSFNMSTDTFLTHFDSIIQKNFLNGIIFLVITIIWSAVPILVIIGAIRKKKLNKKIIQDWEKEILEDYEYIPEEESDIQNPENVSKIEEKEQKE